MAYDDSLRSLNFHDSVTHLMRGSLEEGKNYAGEKYRGVGFVQNEDLPKGAHYLVTRAQNDANDYVGLLSYAPGDYSFLMFNVNQLLNGNDTANKSASNERTSTTNLVLHRYHHVVQHIKHKKNDGNETVEFPTPVMLAFLGASDVLVGYQNPKSKEVDLYKMSRFMFAKTVVENKPKAAAGVTKNTGTDRLRSLRVSGTLPELVAV